MPTPKAGEGQDAFCSRCMKYPDMQKYPPKQRYAICISKYEQHKRKGGKKK